MSLTLSAETDSTTTSVLIVEDHRVVGEGLQAALRINGFAPMLSACESAEAVMEEARTLSPNLVILDTHLADESGWLTCDKLTREMPRLKVLLVGDQPASQCENFASFVGATVLVDRLDGLLAIVTEFADQAVPAVN